MSKAIPLFFWSSKVFENKPKENYGDLLSIYIVARVSGSAVQFYNAPKAQKSWFVRQRRYLMAIGSIMTYTQPKAQVWGCGIISRQDQFQDAQFYAVRGPLSRKRILELGYSCPEVYGDPALLLPHFYKNNTIKKHKLGIIPHYVDYDKVQAWYENDEQVQIIDLLTADALKTTDEIRACDRIISSSLHGVIVAQAYGIPAIWVRFSDKLSGDNVKFEDYFLSVGIKPYTGVLVNESLTETQVDDLFLKYPSVIETSILKQVQEGLLKAFPAT